MGMGSHKAPPPAPAAPAPAASMQAPSVAGPMTDASTAINTRQAQASALAGRQKLIIPMSSAFSGGSGIAIP